MKVQELLEGNGLIYALLALAIGGGGFNLVSEGTEETERNAVTIESREADYILETKYAALLQRVNDMNLELQLVKQQMED